MTNNGPRSGSLIVFSWGAARVMRAQIEQMANAAQRILAYDPNLSLQTMVGPSFYDIPQVKFIEAVPGPRDGNVSLIRYSLPGLSSLTPATSALVDRYPGLQERSRTLVKQRGRDRIASDIMALPEPISILVNAPGGEQLILDLILRGGFLPQVSHIAVRCGVERFFDGSIDAYSAIETLCEAGFEIARDSRDDPDWPELSFVSSPRTRRMRELEARVHAVQLASEATKAETESVRSELAAANAEMEQSKAQATQLQTELLTHQTEVAALEEALTNAAAERDAARELEAKRAAEIDGFRTEAQTLRQGLDETRAALALHQTQVAALQEALANAAAERDEAQNQQALAMRLQLSNLNDLQALRSRYQECYSARVELESLLRKLVVRLREAQGHLLDVVEERGTVLSVASFEPSGTDNTASLKARRNRKRKASSGKARD